jgi:hypothetical protein
MHFISEQNEKYNQYKFFSSHKDKKDLDYPFYDPLLGWDYEIDSQRIRGEKIYQKEKAEGIMRILFIGDSFTYGNEVEDDESFAYFTDNMIFKSEVLNMGVGGFGLGQVLLKYQHHGKKYNPDLVILGIHPPMWNRTNVSFSAYSKPHFVWNSDLAKLELKNSPAPNPQEYFNKIKSQVKKESFILGLVEKWRKDSVSIPLLHMKYFKEMEIVVERILETIQREVEATGSKFMIVQIPLGVRFKGPGSPLSPAHNRLISIYNKLNIPYLDLKDEFLRHHDISMVFNDFYIHRPDDIIGHFSPSGNRAVARIISDNLCGELNSPSFHPPLSLRCSNQIEKLN